MNSSTHSFTVDQIKQIPQGDDEEPGFPTFEVRGTLDGKGFVYNVSIELDGRDADMLPQDDGYDFLAYGEEDPDPVSGLSFDDRAEMQEMIFDKVYATEEFQALEA